MASNTVDKPKFTTDQIVPSAVASKHFGEIRKKAELKPQFISDNGKVSTVVLSYREYELMYQQLREFEDKEEARILESRMERLEQHPETAIPWKKVKRTGHVDEHPTF